MSNPFNISLPSLKSPKDAAFNIKKSKHWAQMLPLGNSGETAKLLFTAIKEVIHIDYSSADRLLFLDSVRMPVKQVCLTLQKHYLDKPIPLPEKARKIADLAIEFHHGLAIGYIQVLTKILGQNSTPTMLNRKQVLRELFKALTHLNLAILKSYQTYAPVPENAWWELHHLYQYALKHKLHRKAVTDEVFYNSTPTIENIYKQILFLSQCDPFSLSGREVELVFTHLESWAEHGQLLNTVAESQRHNEMVIALNVDSDSPPYPALNTETIQADYIFDTTALTHWLDEHAEQEKAKSDNTDIFEPQLLKRIIKAWKGTCERQPPRQQGNGHVDVVIGLSKIHTVIGSQQHVIPATSQMITRRRGTEMRSKRSSPKKLRTSCPIIDESSSGCRLLWFDDEDIKACVGMLIAITQHVPGLQAKIWNIGMIRWVRTDRSGAAEMGMEILMSGAIPAEAIILSQSGEIHRTIQCLKIPDVPEINQVASIVVPALIVRAGEKLRLQYEDEGRTLEETIRLVRAKEQTRHFSFFEYQEDNAHLIIENEEEKQANRFSKKSDDIWSLI